LAELLSPPVKLPQNLQIADLKKLSSLSIGPPQSFQIAGLD